LRDQIILLPGLKEKRNQLKRFDTDRQTTFVHVTRRLCYEQAKEVLFAKLTSLLYFAKMTLPEQRSCRPKSSIVYTENPPAPAGRFFTKSDVTGPFSWTLEFPETRLVTPKIIERKLFSHKIPRKMRTK
jgi:hypothetical protein